MSKIDSLYNHGMKVCIYSQKQYNQSQKSWYRGGENILYFQNNYKKDQITDFSRSYFTLTFTYTFTHDDDSVYFANCFPYTYSQLTSDISRLCNHPRTKQFISRNTLCRTLAGNKCEYLTITSRDKAERRTNRKGIFLSARVHPGETNGSWMMKGVIQFLCSDQPQAMLLRDKYVFKIIPMLNPDGVIHGNYRCSLCGCDLNRRWKTPSKLLHPSIYHAKKLIKQFAQERQMLFYVDLHGHSRKKNIFMYGNNMEREPEQTRLFPYILSKMLDYFSFTGSRFKMQRSKESTARVALFKQLRNNPNIFTMEASFCGASIGEYAGKHFTQSHFMKAGETLCRAILVYCNVDIVKEVKQLKEKQLQKSPPKKAKKFKEDNDEENQKQKLLQNNNNNNNAAVSSKKQEKSSKRFKVPHHHHQMDSEIEASTTAANNINTTTTIRNSLSPKKKKILNKKAKKAKKVENDQLLKIKSTKILNTSSSNLCYEQTEKSQIHVDQQQENKELNLPTMKFNRTRLLNQLKKQKINTSNYQSSSGSDDNPSQDNLQTNELTKYIPSNIRSKFRNNIKKNKNAQSKKRNPQIPSKQCVSQLITNRTQNAINQKKKLQQNNPQTKSSLNTINQNKSEQQQYFILQNKRRVSESQKNILSSSTTVYKDGSFNSQKCSCVVISSYKPLSEVGRGIVGMSVSYNSNAEEQKLLSSSNRNSISRLKLKKVEDDVFNRQLKRNLLASVDRRKFVIDFGNNTEQMMNDSLSIIGKSAQRCYEAGGECTSVNVLTPNGYKRIFKRDTKIPKPDRNSFGNKTNTSLFTNRSKNMSHRHSNTDIFSATSMKQQSDNSSSFFDQQRQYLVPPSRNLSNDPKKHIYLDLNQQNSNKSSNNNSSQSSLQQQQQQEYREVQGEARCESQDRLSQQQSMRNKKLSISQFHALCAGNANKTAENFQSKYYSDSGNDNLKISPPHAINFISNMNSSENQKNRRSSFSGATKSHNHHNHHHHHLNISQIQPFNTSAEMIKPPRTPIIQTKDQLPHIKQAMDLKQQIKQISDKNSKVFQRNQLLTNSYSQAQQQQPFQFSNISNAKASNIIAGSYYNKGNPTLSTLPHFTKILNRSTPSPGNLVESNISASDLNNSNSCCNNNNNVTNIQTKQHQYFSNLERIEQLSGVKHSRAGSSNTGILNNLSTQMSIKQQLKFGSVKRNHGEALNKRQQATTTTTKEVHVISKKSQNTGSKSNLRRMKSVSGRIKQQQYNNSKQQYKEEKIKSPREQMAGRKSILNKSSYVLNQQKEERKTMHNSFTFNQCDKIRQFDSVPRRKPLLMGD